MYRGLQYANAIATRRYFYLSLSTVTWHQKLTNWFVTIVVKNRKAEGTAVIKNIKETSNMVRSNQVENFLVPDDDDPQVHAVARKISDGDHLQMIIKRSQENPYMKRCRSLFTAGVGRQCQPLVLTICKQNK